MEVVLRKLGGILLVISLFAVFVAGSRSSNDLTQAVIKVTNLNSAETQRHLLKEFDSLDGISSCEMSLLTKTITLRYNDRSLSKQQISDILKKWDCSAMQFSFSKLVNCQSEKM